MTAQAEHAIEVRELVKKYGDLVAVDHVSFEVGAREIFGFLGPNGAGKSTTIKMLVTLLRPTAGHALIAGHDVVAAPDLVRHSIGIVFQDPSLDERLTAEENLQFHAWLYSVPPRIIDARIDQVLGIVGLGDRRKALVKTFSGGMKRRLEIARGLVHHPKVLFLDEPTVGLDPQTRIAIWDHVRRLRDEIGITVFMTTHYMDEAENCDRIGIIDLGRIQAIDTPQALKRQIGGDTVILRGNDDDTELGADLEARYALQPRRVGDAFHFQVPEGAEFIPRLISDMSGRVRSVQVKQPSLDDVFLELTGRQIREEEGNGLGMMSAMRRVWSSGGRNR